MKRTSLAVLLSTVIAVQAYAQEPYWIQVEAEPTLTDAQFRANDYDSTFDTVNGFLSASGWYAIALGPFDRDTAVANMRRLKAQGIIPGDSFLTDGDQFRERFWPVNAAASDSTEAATTPVLAPPAADPLPITPPDQTVAEARRSEAALSATAREELQIALRWAGFYNAAIDGAFGRGTRAAMEAWQQANNHEPTGVLTTAQRAELLRQYNAVLEGLGLTIVSDSSAGIEMLIPMSVVEFTSYDPPFARFDAIDGSDAQVLLISQPGDSVTLAALYDVLQTLEIVPPEGPRSRRGDSFQIEGVNSRIHTHIQAATDGRTVKGFALVWPAGDEERRSRLLSEMQQSYREISGALDPNSVPIDESQSIDFVSGLAIRYPASTASGVFVDASGAVLTALPAVEACDALTINRNFAASIAHRDPATGLAVLRPEDPLAPISVARFDSAVPRLGARVGVAGYSYGGVLPMPTVTYGTLEDLRGLGGEEHLKRLSVSTAAGDVGGGIMNLSGDLLGILAATPADGDRQLPPGVGFAVDTDAILPVLSAAGISALSATPSGEELTPTQRSNRAAEIVALVGCWQD